MDGINDVLNDETGDRKRATDRHEHDGSAPRSDSGKREPGEAPPKLCPIIDEYPVGSFGVYPSSLIKARIAVVGITARGEYIAYLDRSPTTRELVRKRVRFVSEVDMGLHQTRIISTAPATDDMFDFGVDVNLRWRVSDPTTVVRDGIRDVRATLGSLVLARIRSITRQFKPERSADAESKINDALAMFPEANSFGFVADGIARLSMADAVRDEFQLGRRVSAYRKIIAAGDLGQFAFILAMNPDDASAVVKALVEERDRARQDTIDFVTKLVESGAIERWQVADQIRVALQRLLDGSNRVITGTDEARPPSFGPDVINPDQPENAGRDTGQAAQRLSPEPPIELV